MRSRKHIVLATVGVLSLSIGGYSLWAGDDAPGSTPGSTPASTSGNTAIETAGGDAVEPVRKWQSAVNPKPLSENVRKGLQWLVDRQLENGGWGQGEESQQMGRNEKLADTASVADTCVAALALIRSGSTPAKGDYAKPLGKAVAFICKEIEDAEANGMHITKLRGTRVQSKIGAYVDTFFAAMLLAEVKDSMPDDDSRKRVVTALDKVMDKIEKNQKEDGSWGDAGWAPVMGQSVATKALNRAAQAGAEVSEEVRARTEANAQDQYDDKTKSFKGAGSAGVAIYSASASVSQLADNDATNKVKRDEVARKLSETKDADERKQLQFTLDRYDTNEKALDAARKTVVDKLDDPSFIAGFGSNGGEEFLSYMNIGEALVGKGGDDWKKWDEQITKNLNRIQNQDGSWTGHHCITGKTFCTSTALLTLMVDRTPVPVAAKLGKR